MIILKNSEIRKSVPFIINEELAYASGSVVMKTIMSSVTGNICTYAVDSGEELTRNIFPFDNLVQIIEGSTEIIIDSKSNLMELLLRMRVTH